jgi:hypothetical protein
LKYLENYICNRAIHEIEKTKDEFQKLNLENQLLKKDIVIIVIKAKLLGKSQYQIKSSNRAEKG